jgi:hypothetical protein
MVLQAPGDAFAQSGGGKTPTQQSKVAKAKQRAPAAPIAPAAEEPAKPAGKSVEELAQAAQNPVAAMISVPFQNNFNFNQTTPGATHRS